MDKFFFSIDARLQADLDDGNYATGNGPWWTFGIIAALGEPLRLAALWRTKIESAEVAAWLTMRATLGPIFLSACARDCAYATGIRPL
jgi:hypothetical protein